MFGLIIVSKETFELLREQNQQLSLQSSQEKQSLQNSYSKIIESMQNRIEYLERLNERLLQKQGIGVNPQKTETTREPLITDQIFTRTQNQEALNRAAHERHLEQVRAQMEVIAEGMLPASSNGTGT